MNEKITVIITYIIIFGVLATPPMVLFGNEYKPWMVIVACVPIAIFVLMRLLNFMNEIESGCLCIIMVVLVSMIFPAIKLKTKHDQKLEQQKNAFNVYK